MKDSVEPEKRPHMPACTNQNSSLSRSFSPMGPDALVQVPRHHRHAETAEEHLVVVQAQSPADEIQAGVDVLGGPREAVLSPPALFSCRSWNFASPVSTVFTERSSQSRLKW